VEDVGQIAPSVTNSVHMDKHANVDNAWQMATIVAAARNGTRRRTVVWLFPVKPATHAATTNCVCINSVSASDLPALSFTAALAGMTPTTSALLTWATLKTSSEKQNPCFPEKKKLNFPN
jgi:hypothetical protein